MNVFFSAFAGVLFAFWIRNQTWFCPDLEAEVAKAVESMSRSVGGIEKKAKVKRHTRHRPLFSWSGDRLRAGRKRGPKESRGLRSACSGSFSVEWAAGREGAFARKKVGCGLAMAPRVPSRSSVTASKSSGSGSGRRKAGAGSAAGSLPLNSTFLAGVFSNKSARSLSAARMVTTRAAHGLNGTSGAPAAPAPAGARRRRVAAKAEGDAPSAAPATDGAKETIFTVPTILTLARMVAIPFVVLGEQHEDKTRHDERERGETRRSLVRHTDRNAFRLLLIFVFFLSRFARFFRWLLPAYTGQGPQAVVVCTTLYILACVTDWLDGYVFFPTLSLSPIFSLRSEKDQKIVDRRDQMTGK